MASQVLTASAVAEGERLAEVKRAFPITWSARGTQPMAPSSWRSTRGGTSPPRTTSRHRWHGAAAVQETPPTTMPQQSAPRTQSFVRICVEAIAERRDDAQGAHRSISRR